jgi:hypothetical protein
MSEIPQHIQEKINSRYWEQKNRSERYGCYYLIPDAIFGYQLSDEEVELLNSTINNQHKLMIDAEQRGFDKAIEEIAGLKAEIERLKGLIEKIYKDSNWYKIVGVYLAKGVPYEGGENEYVKLFNKFKSKNNL